MYLTVHGLKDFVLAMWEASVRCPALCIGRDHSSLLAADRITLVSFPLQYSPIDERFLFKVINPISCLSSIIYDNDTIRLFLGFDCIFFDEVWRIFVFYTTKDFMSGVRPWIEFYPTDPPDTAALSSADDTQRLGWISVAFYGLEHSIR